MPLARAPYISPNPTRAICDAPTAVPWRNRVAQHETQNSMSVQNLAIVFGPTLFNSALSGMADTSLQNRVRETAGRFVSCRELVDVCLPFICRRWRRFSSTTPISSWRRARSLSRPGRRHLSPMLCTYRPRHQRQVPTSFLSACSSFLCIGYRRIPSHLPHLPCVSCYLLLLHPIVPCRTFCPTTRPLF